MSALDRPKIEDAERVIKAAEEMLNALCHGKRFEMTIPVQENDADIVIGNALYIARELLRERAERVPLVALYGDCQGVSLEPTPPPPAETDLPSEGEK